MKRDEMRQLIADSLRELKIERVIPSEISEGEEPEFMLSHPTGRVVDLGEINVGDFHYARRVIHSGAEGIALFAANLIFDELRCLACEERREDDTDAVVALCGPHEATIRAAGFKP